VRQVLVGLAAALEKAAADADVAAAAAAAAEDQLRVGLGAEEGEVDASGGLGGYALAAQEAAALAAKQVGTG
jgi:hypothetical protein